MKHAAFLLALLFVTCAPASAQTGFTGTWQIESTPPWTVVLRPDGSRVAGRVSQCSSQVSTEIYEGRIDGNTVTFKCASGDGDRTVTLTGTLNGDEIAFAWDLQVRPGGSPADPNAAGRAGIFASSRRGYTARRVPDGELAQETDRVRGVELAAAVNLPQQDMKGEAVLFLAQKVDRVRGVIVVISWGLGFDAYDDPEWRRLAETLEFGLIRARIRHMSEPNASLIGPGRVPAQGGADTLLMLLRRLAEVSGHQELTSAPMLFWGHSAAGGQISGLAALLPQRTIAFVRYHSGASTGDLKVVSRIPALVLVGGKDPGNQGDTETMWKSGRSTGAPWTFGTEPNATHGDPNDLKKANHLLMPWVTAVVRQRLSPDGPTLRAVTEGSAWLGNNQTGEAASYGTFSGSKLEASWLPDEASARGWQTIRNSSDKATSDKGTPDKTIPLSFFTPIARDPRDPILGVWRGPVTEGAKEYGMEILLEHLIVGEPAGRILFYGLGRENWTVGSSMVLRERNADGVYVFCSTSDVSRGCGGGPNDGQVHLRLLENEQLQYVEPGPGSAPVSMGILERKVGGR